MENIIPINGRIAIIDDDIKQAEPLIRVLSKNNIPYTYYKGNDIEYFPASPENDIRILFLDINLLGGKVHTNKEIRALLVPTIKRIISPENYPYAVILWSREDSEQIKLIMDIFENELKHCAPIVIKTFIKSVFFPNYSEEIEESADAEQIIPKLRETLLEIPGYSYLLQWENCIHNAADTTLQEIFHEYHSLENWNDNACYILDLFAKSSLEHYYKTATQDLRAKSSLLFFNDVYRDTLENIIDNSHIDHPAVFSTGKNESDRKHISAKINEKILLSQTYNSNCKQPGTVISPRNVTSDESSLYRGILNDCIKTEDIRAKIEENYRELPNCEKRNKFKNLFSCRKKEIEPTITPCNVVVTPACDYAQGRTDKKVANIRIVKGVLIAAEHKDKIDGKSEAVYVSPIFNYNNSCKVLLLDFRHFTTIDSIDTNSCSVLFRIRTSMLAEIQSRLARHINRQGIMSL